ncbi:MAG: hypothetical protein JW820_11190 [Spirochaetales bacterium]|nr:hypothetical protein [Spirochaetales bacterium]
MGARGIACFWIGFGTRVRVPGAGLLGRLRDGTIREVVDIGCAGALDPSMRRGDLVLSSDDVPVDTGKPLRLVRNPDARSIAGKVAEAWGVTLAVAPILTHERAVLSREERLALFERTGCAAVQMEHAWFLRLLEQLVPAAIFGSLRFTHLVLITDSVPRPSGREDGPASGPRNSPGRSGRAGAGGSGGTRTETLRASWDAIRGYAFPGRRGIGSLRREFLRRWLGG